MMRSIFLRTLYDRRWFVLGWGTAMAVTAGLMVAMYPAFREGMSEILATIPTQFQGLAGDASSFDTMHSYIASQFFDIRVPLLLMIAGAVLGIGLSVAPEEKGQLRTVLSGRVSRVGWYIQTWYSALFVIGAIVALMTFVTILAIWFVGEPIPWWVLLKLSLMTISYIMMTFTIVYALGSATGSRAIALGIGVSVIFASFILDIGSAVDWLEPLQFLSLLSYFDAASVPSEGVNLADQLVILIILTLSFLMGMIFFRRRDIA